MPQSQFLKVALEAAHNAEEVILKYYADSIRIEFKPDATPVTIADREAERVIIETIQRAFPDHGFLGEESGDTHSESGYHRIIDPIDGTKNYIHKIPLFATQIALMKDGERILGVSNAPLIKELLYAERGAGAFMNDQPIRVSEVAEASDAMICHGGLDWFDSIGMQTNIRKLITNSSQSRGFGDFYIFHTLASGRTDIAVEGGHLQPWDIAALAVIVEEAGGKITDMERNVLTLSPSPVIATNGVLHEQVLDYFRDVTLNTTNAT